jgi:ABC-2 type transport system permease protein
MWRRPSTWALTAVVLAAMAWELVRMLGPFLGGQSRLLASVADIGYTDLVLLPWLALFVIALVLLAPLVTMSTLAGERRHGTLGLLFASGYTPARIVLGKYLAVLGWLLALLAVLGAMVGVLALAGSPDWGKLAAALLGLVLLMALLAAIGMACSAWARHSALAAAATLAIVLALILIERAAVAPGIITGFVHWLALPTHLQPMGRGLVRSADVAWFVIMTALALALAVVRLNLARDGD